MPLQYQHDTFLSEEARAASRSAGPFGLWDEIDFSGWDEEQDRLYIESVAEGRAEYYRSRSRGVSFQFAWESVGNKDLSFLAAMIEARHREIEGYLLAEIVALFPSWSIDPDALIDDRDFLSLGKISRPTARQLAEWLNDQVDLVDALSGAWPVAMDPANRHSILNIAIRRRDTINIMLRAIRRKMD